VFWYLRVVEEQKRKAPHYHALVYAPFIAQARLSALAEKAGLGSVVGIRAADIRERAGYAGYAAKVANYATKTARGQQVNPTPKGRKRRPLQAPNGSTCPSATSRARVRTDHRVGRMIIE
jgi:hypothetical protein